MVWEVEVCTEVDAFVVDDTCSVVIDSDVQLSSGKPNVLLMTFLAGYEIDQVTGCTGEIVPDRVCGSTSCGGEVFATVEVEACDTSWMITSSCSSQ